MTQSQNPLLTEVAAGLHGPPISASTRAYFQQRLRNRMLKLLLERFIAAQKQGLTKAALARRIGKTPDVVNRWLGAPSNLTLDTISDLLIGIMGEEMELSAKSIIAQPKANYLHFAQLASIAMQHAAQESSRNDAGLRPQSRASLGGARAGLAMNPDANSSRRMSSTGEK